MLKKIVLTTAAIAMAAGSVYAAATAGYIETVPGITFKPSNNVKIAYLGDGTATNPQTYLIAAKHTSGNTYYATSNLTSLVYKKEVATSPGTVLAATGDSNLTGLIAGETVFSGFTAQ